MVRRFGVHSSCGFPIPALSRYVDTPASAMKKIGMSNENIFAGLPELVGSIWINGCVSIATAQTARLVMMSFFFSDVFMGSMMPCDLDWMHRNGKQRLPTQAQRPRRAQASAEYRAGSRPRMFRRSRFIWFWVVGYSPFVVESS
jgi:hypothetical protein